MNSLLSRCVALAALSVGFLASSAHSVPVIGLTQGTSALITFDTSTPGVTTAPVAVTGLGAGESLLGIDFRPANGQLFGLGGNSTLYTINPTTGAATLVGIITGLTPAGLSGTSFGVDFNPTVDRFRIVSDADLNVRVNPINGAALVDANLNPGNPNVVGAAYANNFSVSMTTTLYVLDSLIDQLLIQSPPNDGTLTSVGSVGVDFNDMAGFDIFGAGSAFAALNTAGAATGFYSINLATGAASLVGNIGGGSLVADIAVALATAVPEPATLALLGVGLAGLALSRRKRA